MDRVKGKTGGKLSDKRHQIQSFSCISDVEEETNLCISQSFRNYLLHLSTG